MTTLREIASAIFLLLAASAAPLNESNLDEMDTGGGEEASGTTVSAVYGRDDRYEINQLQNPVYKSAAPVVAMIVEAEDLKPTSKTHSELQSVGYGESLNLCRSERFWGQPRIGFCTGVLIRPNLILTAGHCILNQIECDKARFVFDLSYDESDEIQMSVSNEKIRSCKIIRKRQNKKSGMDYALIELDRDVTDRAPAHWSPQITLSHSVFMIGHPLGLPAKFSGPAKITKDEDLFWLTDLDSSAGNSGSPVFNAADGGLVGLLTAGEEGDFEGQKNSCKVTKQCTSKSCFGEVVVKLSKIIQDANL